MVRLRPDIAKTVEAAHGEPLTVELPGSDRAYVLVDYETHAEAMAALEYRRNVELIREGVANMEAGRTQPLEEAMAEIRCELVSRTANDV